MYYVPDSKEPIRQGDIFRWLPKLELVTGDDSTPLLYEQKDFGSKEIDWLKTAPHVNKVVANVLARPVLGIVITQDCDASRELNISFCEVKPFIEVCPLYDEKTMKVNSFIRMINEQSRRNQKWYYLAESGKVGFAKKMGVDFLSVFMVPRDFLEKYIDTLRIGRLNEDVAYPHFRERISDFFRRYPYNEWYPFNSEELEEYERKTKIDIRYPWQS